MSSLIDLFYGGKIEPTITTHQEPTGVSHSKPTTQSSLKELIELCFSASGRLALEFLQEAAKDGHRHYTVWSEVLNAQARFVCCQETAAELMGQGISRGDIYTKTELLELAKHPNPSPGHLKDLHKVKSQFGAILIHVEPSPGDGKVS